MSLIGITHRRVAASKCSTLTCEILAYAEEYFT